MRAIHRWNFPFESAWRRLLVAAGASCLLVGPFSLARLPAEDAKPDGPRGEPPLERLLQLNARDIFGGEAAVGKERVTVKYLPGKPFEGGFRVQASGSRGGIISDLGEIKDPNLKKIVSEGIEGSFSFAVLEGGEALSKFELADDFKITLKMRVDLVPPAGQITFRFNSDGKSFIQTTFFQDITVVAGGKPRRKLTTDQRLAGAPTRWFVQKHAPALAVPFEIVYKEKKLSISMRHFSKKDEKEGESIQVVSLEGIEKPSKGRLHFKFSKMTLGVADLVIEGKYDRAWAEAEVARLRKDGRLRLKEDDPIAVARKDEGPQDRAKAQGAETRRSSDKAKAQEAEPRRPKRPKKGPPNVNEPDPEADDDL